MSTKKDIIDYIVEHCECDYHLRKWKCKIPGKDVSSWSVAWKFFGNAMTADNLVMVHEMFKSKHIMYLCSSQSVFQTNFQHPELLNAIKHRKSLEHCNAVLEQNPATVYATDKYGDGPLYHLVQRSTTQDSSFIIPLFTKIIDVTGIPQDDLNGENMLYLVSSSEVLAKHPSFLETLILRGLNVNFVFGKRFSPDGYDCGVSQSLLGRTLESVKSNGTSIIRLTDMMLQRGANINWVDEHGEPIVLCFDWYDNDEIKYDFVLDYLLCNGANFGDGAANGNNSLCKFYSKLCQRKAGIVNRWPTMMAMIVFECLCIYHLIDCDTWTDLFSFTSQL